MTLDNYLGKMEWVFRRSPGYVLDDVRIGSLAQPKPVGMKEGSQKGTYGVSVFKFILIGFIWCFLSLLNFLERDLDKTRVRLSCIF
jgi:hypothetical protein